MDRILITLWLFLFLFGAKGQQRTIAFSEDIRIYSLKIDVQEEDSDVPDFIYALMECENNLMPESITIGSTLFLSGQSFFQFPVTGDSIILQFRIDKFSRSDYYSSLKNPIRIITVNGEKLTIQKRFLSEKLTQEVYQNDNLMKDIDPERKTWTLKDFIIKRPPGDPEGDGLSLFVEECMTEE